MIVKRDFYDQPTVRVARELLGCFLVRKYRGKILRARITETEAYRGEYDLACHASRGRTGRTEIMYGQAGHAYIYLVYGMHQMINVVTEKKDFPSAVLIRAVGLEGKKPALNGPGKVTKFFHIDKTLNGHDLTHGEKLWLECPKNKGKLKIIRSPRIGVDYAGHCKAWKWNFRVV